MLNSSVTFGFLDFPYFVNRNFHYLGRVDSLWFALVSVNDGGGVFGGLHSY